MTDKDVLKMAELAGFVCGDKIFDEVLLCFAGFVAAAEREACAKVCDVISEPAYDGYESPNTFDDGKSACAEAIRARGNDV